MAAQSESSPAADRILLLAAILVGFALRLWRLGAESLWYDETVSAFLAGKSVTEIVARTAGDIHPPGYYLLLNLWAAVSNPQLEHGFEFLLAWPSLFFSILILALVYAIGLLLFDRTIALLALWLSVAHPFQIWYGQEVRMYALAAALGLLVLLAALRWLRARPGEGRSLLALYVVSAAACLYTLYYTLFLLAAVNILVLTALWRRGHIRRVGLWSLAQAALLLLFAPWLPIFVRQVVEPPVPVWRQPWQNVGEIGAALVESLGSLLIGQTPPFAIHPAAWALLTVALCLGALRAIQHVRARAGVGIGALLLYILTPLLLIYLISAWLTPIYHVRYIYLYATPFTLVMALVIKLALRSNRSAGALLLLALLLVQGFGLHQFWSNPAFRSDAHRQAVTDLATWWRPGDVILVNAGWAYTALEVYWPRQPMAISGARPAPLSHVIRLGAPHGPLSAENEVTLVRSGSIGGDASLGWGSAQSDFFPLSVDESAAALSALAANSARIWHYRIYDTVSDPDGFIRSWLAAHATKVIDDPYAGRDYLRIERYDTNRPLSPLPAKDGVAFGDALYLDSHAAPAQIHGGETAYVNLRWQTLPAFAELPGPLSMSLRLTIDAESEIAQQDESPLPATDAWPHDSGHSQALALPIATSTPPGAYWLELIVYAQSDGTPLPLPEDARSVFGQRWRLGRLEVMGKEQ